MTTPVMRDKVPRDEFPPVKCGDLGHLTSRGRPCGRYCVPGTRGCPRHGGTTAKSLALALRNVDTSRVLTAAQRITDYTAEVDVHPHQILIESTWRLSALVKALDTVVQQSADPDTGEPQPAAVSAYVKAIEACMKAAKAALDANLDERKFRVQTTDMKRFAELVLSAVRDPRVALSQTQQDTFLAVIAEAMRSGGMV